MFLKPIAIERLLLIVLILLSAYLFWMRFRKVLGRIRASRPDPDFRVRPIGRRIFRFFAEVMFQSKVIHERPLPGIAHAFVFWGFCVFALVTVNHFAWGLGWSFFDRHEGFGRFYWWFAFLFAVLVAVGIFGLFIRRFVVRPKWLEPLSYESGVIAGLIFLLTISYMPMWWYPEETATGHILWWLHTLAILAFLPLIPHTKHLHLLFSPFTVFLSRGGFSKIPPLAGDEDFGFDTGKDITRLAALQAYSCVECGRCTEHCPANNTGKELNPKLIALGVRNYLNEFGNNAETPIVGATISQTAIFQCTTCGACEYQCPVGVEHLPLIVGLRRSEVNTGRWEDEYGTKLFLNLERQGNALGFSATERDKFIAKEQLPIFDGSQQYCLWLGCMGGFDPRGREIISSFAAVMRYLGTSFGVVKKERCTGDPARRLGNDLVFGQLTESNLEALRNDGVKRVVSICPHCVRTIAEDWKEFGATVEIEHHSEFMARHRHLLPQSERKTRVVFHDPCYLGRYRNIYDEPRDVIAQTSQVVDPPRSRERSFCCGAGGGLVFLGEETGQRVNETRVRELVATGAEIVGAACPFCNSMFRDALASASATPPELLDIAQLTARAIESQQATNA
jgi:Fe-S oxidoreductase